MALGIHMHKDTRQCARNEADSRLATPGSGSFIAKQEVDKTIDGKSARNQPHVSILPLGPRATTQVLPGSLKRDAQKAQTINVFVGNLVKKSLMSEPNSRIFIQTPSRTLKLLAPTHATNKRRPAFHEPSKQKLLHDNFGSWPRWVKCRFGPLLAPFKITFVVSGRSVRKVCVSLIGEFSGW